MNPMHIRLFVRLLSAAAVLVLTSPAAAAQSPAPAACIAIATPAIQGIAGSATEIGTAARDLFAAVLKGPSVQPVALEALLPSQAMEEARQKGCGHVLIATLTGKRSGGSTLGRIAGQAAGAAAWHIPYGGSAGAAVVRGVAVGTAQAVSMLASSTKVRDELRLEYRLMTTDNGVRIPSTTDKAKASVNGEDLLTPLVQRAAEAIITAVAKPTPR